MSAHHLQRPVLLGKRVASYRSMRPSTLTVVAWLGIALLLITKLAEIGLGPAAVWPTLALLSPAIIWLGWQLQVPRRVDLYQHGLDYRIGRRHRYVFWNQIYEIYQTPLHTPRLSRASASIPDCWMYRMVRRDGRSLWFFHLESIRTLGQRVQEQVSRRHLPLALDAFHAGYAIRFGRQLSISLDRVVIRRRKLTWDEIAEVTIDETNEFVITCVTGDRRYRLPIRTVPNLLMLNGVLRASQDRINQDPHDVAPFRADTFEGPVYDSAGGGADVADPFEDRSDDFDSNRPRRPK